MDPVINSLTQSPFVRSLSKVPSKASNFTYGLRDNVPPFSMQKVVVKPYNNPSKTTQKATHKFKIPQYGTLNRAYLRIRMKNQNVPQAHWGPLNWVNDLQALHDDAGVGAAPVAESLYQDLAGKFRIPWIHHTQLHDRVQKVAPFGGGGGVFCHNGVARDPRLFTGGIPQSVAGYYTADFLITSPSDMQGKASNGWNVINIMDNITLSAGGKILETLPAETIPSQVVKMPEQQRDFYIAGMVGYADGSDLGAQMDKASHENPWDPSMVMRDIWGMPQSSITPAIQVPIARNQHANFIVPLPLACLENLRKNYHTKFSEAMELSIDMKELGRGFNEYTGFAVGEDPSQYHELELVLIYHNWHDSIDAQLKSANFKQNIPAQIYSSNWYSEPGPFKVISDTEPLTIPLTCRNLATEIVIVGKSLGAGADLIHETLQKRKSDYTMDLEKGFQYDLEFFAGNKSIWKGSNVELHGPDSAPYNLLSAPGALQGSGFGGSSRARSDLHFEVDGRGEGWRDSIATSHGYTHGGVDMSFSDNMSILRFGMNASSEFYSGGLALQTIASPKIVITPYQGRYGSRWVEKKMEFNVYVKHANMVEIDSETGSIRTTLNV